MSKSNRVVLIGWRFTDGQPLAILDMGADERGLILAPDAIVSNPDLWGSMSAQDRAEVQAGPVAGRLA